MGTKIARLADRPNLWPWLLLTPLALYLAVFFLVPLIDVAIMSVTEPRLSLANYQKVLTGSLYQSVFLNTFLTAALVTVACLCVGYPLAYLMNRSKPGTAMLILLLVTMSFWTSFLVRTYAWMVLLGRNGIINRILIDSGLMEQPLPMLNSKMAVILGMVHVMLPFMILPIYSAVTRIDPDLPKAARGLGASALRIVTTIYLPLTLRGIVAGVTLVFVVSLGFYITPALLGGGKVLMFAMVIEQQVREFLAWNFAGALSVILLAVTLFVFWLLNQGVTRRLGD